MCRSPCGRWCSTPPTPVGSRSSTANCSVFSTDPGDEPPADGEPDVNGADWLVLRDGERRVLAFQQVAELPEPTWPEGPRPQMMHLDIQVDSAAELESEHARAVELGARLLLDRFDDPEEPLRVYADPAGHPFCIFVA